jgi:uncharacterized lipoprotein YehR (DUF1307 family)
MKKILALLLVLVMAFSFVGCNKEESAADQVKTPQELMDKVMEASKTSRSGEFNGSFEMTMSGLEEMGLAGPMSLNMSGKVADEKNVMVKMDVDAGIGMVINAEMYLNEDQMLLYAPLLGQFMGYSYMSMDMSQVTEMAGSDISTEDAEKVMAVLERFEDETDYSIYDVLKIDDNMAEETITINDEEVDTTKLVMTIELDKAVDVMYGFLEFVTEDEEARELLLGQMTQEDIDMMIEEMEDPATKAELEAALEMININELSMDLYINGDFIPVKMDMVFDMTVSEGDETLDMNMTGSFEFFNIGGVESIEFPEVSPEEVMDMTDMMGIY